MPVDYQEYDTFEFKHFDEAPLTLEEATTKTAHLRTTDAGNFHRIVPLDPSMITFRVESVPPISAYAEAISRWTTLMNRFAVRLTKR